MTRREIKKKAESYKLTAKDPIPKPVKKEPTWKNIWTDL